MKVLRTLVLVLLGLTGSVQAQSRFEFSRPQMGTTFRIVLYAPDSLEASEAADAAFARIDELNGLFSDYLDGSEASRLSAGAGSGRWQLVSNEMWSVLSESISFSRATDGAFDVTIGALTRPWREAMRRGQLPVESATQEALDRVGFRWIKMDTLRKAVRLEKSGMRLDFGGIAKGYAADEALRELRSRDILSVLIDAGGDIVLGCAPPGRPGWNIAVPGNESGRGQMSVLSDLQSVAVASSGATYQYIEADGVRYSHILNPATGKGVTAERLVSVAAPNGMLADALASAVSVLGIKGMDTAIELGAIWVRIRERRGDEYIIEDRGSPSGSASNDCPAR